MPRSNHIPSYRLHTASGQARVIIDGRHHYLGLHGSSESKEKYARLIAERFASGEPTVQRTNGQEEPSELSVNEIVLSYWRFAKTYYVKDGEPTKELSGMRDALRPVRKLYGRTSAREFGPLALKAVRRHMIDVQKLARTEINKRIGRIKRAFKWAVSEELIPPGVFEGLHTVVGLRFGRTEARETEPIKPVPDAHVNALLPFLAPPISAMIQLQRLTGMRPCEVVMMRLCEIATSDEVWIYEPFEHKNRWRGHSKRVPLGPKAQKVLAQFLDRPDAAFLFSPKDADEWYRANRAIHRKTNRKTPIYPSELKAREKAKQARRKKKRKRPLRNRYDTASYRRAITYGLLKARKAGTKIPHWHPNQLRHSRGTEVRRQYGIEGAQVSLGHARAEVTEIYAEKNLGLAIKIAQESG